MAAVPPSTHDVWLEFLASDGGNETTAPFAQLRLVDRAIVGAGASAPLALRHPGFWLLHDDELCRYEGFSAMGVYSVHLESLDGTEWRIDCTSVLMEGEHLMVDARAVARLDELAGQWFDLTRATRLRAIRLEPDAARRVDEREARAGARSRGGGGASPRRTRPAARP